jgi:hypothetical protein
MLAPASTGTTNWVARCRRCHVASSAGVWSLGWVASWTSSFSPFASVSSAISPIRAPQ